MALVNNDMRKIEEALIGEDVKRLALYFSKEMGYPFHTNIPKTKKSIHFYNDHKKNKPPYAITLNKDSVTFYFRKTSNNACLYVTQLEKEFGIGNVTDNRKSTSSTKGELHIRIHDLEKAEHLISQYIPSLN